MKNISLLIITVILITALTGCGNKDQMTNYIPTLTPEAEDTNDSMIDPNEDKEQDTEETGSSNDANTEDGTGNDITPTQPVSVGQTTTKYVKLKEYSDYLNIRSAPSTKGEIVGFLVHTEKVSVVEEVDGWASIVYKGHIYYVKADYLAEERPAFLEPPTPTTEPVNTPTPAQED